MNNTLDNHPNNGFKKNQQMRFFVFFLSMIGSHFCNIKPNRHRNFILLLMIKYIFSLSLLLLSTFAVGQGWERTYGGGGQDAANAVAQTPDGGYILVGKYNLTQLLLMKTDDNGNLQWSKNYLNLATASGVVVSSDGGYVIAGTLNGNILLMKTDAFGNQLWLKTFGNASAETGLGLVQTADGGFAIVGKRAGTVPSLLVVRTNALGNQLWINSYGQPENPVEFAGVDVASNGDLVISSDKKVGNTPNPKDIYVARIDNASGQVIWENAFPFTSTAGFQGNEEPHDVSVGDDGSIFVTGFTSTFNSNGGDGFISKIASDGSSILWTKANFNFVQFYGIEIADNGDIFACGYKSFFTGLDDVYILHTDPNGNTIWETKAGKGGFDVGNAVIATPDGGCVVAGSSEPYVSGGSIESKTYLVKTDANGLIFTSYIRGHIFNDANLNCLLDSEETNLEDWIVVISGDDFTRYAVARDNGTFDVAVDTGLYSVHLITPNVYWKTCTPTIDVLVPAFYDTIDFEVPVRADELCPRNEVDVATPILRRCEENTYNIRYCNSGTTASPNTYVVVNFDAGLIVTSSSISGLPLGNNSYRYDVGTLNNGQCNSFQVKALLDCATTTEGQTHCVTAHIYPDTFCQPLLGWDGAFIVAQAICINDSVRMILTNTGIGGMGTPLGFVIAQDVVMLTPPPSDPNALQFQLGMGENATVWTQPSDGKTYRIIAEQSPGYPGVSLPTAAVEGCISDTSSAFVSQGFYTMFPEDDADAFVATDCQQSAASDYNPIYLKRGHPKGYDVPHYVTPETDLDYLIQFRNTGADTVQQVIIRDVLSIALDPATVLPGASSHPYTLNIFGNGIVEFTLSNIQLPPGGSASEGFVRFRVSQKPDLPCNTKIYNRAAITFDFEAPVITGETFHTVCEFDSFIIITKTKNIFQKGADLKVYPNPAQDVATFELTGVEANTYSLQIYDIQGRLIDHHFYNNPTFRLFRHQLPAGTLFYRLAADGKPVASGTLLIK